MSSDALFDQRVSQYLDNEINAEAFDLLCEQLAGDPDLRQRFLKISALDSAIALAADHRDRQSTIHEVLANAEMESEQDSIFELYRMIEAQKNKQAAREFGARDILPLAGYVAGQALRDTRVIKVLVAAVLLIVVLLAISLIGPDKSPEAREISVSAQQPDIAVQPPAQVPVVAALTAERDALWGRRPGQDLYAGQRFTLTQGFAEITTERGAVAIIQAPASIEMLENENAIYLYSGKLIGICETESSKGFQVRTPHMSVTDLGTRFGVAVDDAGNALTEVLTGSVMVVSGNPASTPFENQLLMEGDVFVVDSAGQSAGREVFEPQTFAELIQTDLAKRYTVNGIASLSGDIRRLAGMESIAFSGHLPTSSDHAWVYPELTGTRLDSDLPLNLFDAGEHREFDRSQSGGRAAQGMVIRSYILYVSPDGPREKGVLYNIKGKVVFDGEVLGVITNVVNDQQFAEAVGPDQPRVVRFRNEGAGPESSGTGPGGNDLVTIGTDRKTIAFNFTAAGGALDMIRVIVQEPAD